MQQHSGSGDNIAQTGDRSVGKAGDGSIVQTGDNPNATINQTKEDPASSQAPEWTPMRWTRLVAFVLGAIVLVLTALTVIFNWNVGVNWKVGTGIGVFLMGGSAALPTASKLLGVGG